MERSANQLAIGPLIAPQALLRFVDARVRRDRGASGLAGVICIGIREGGRTVWWIAHFGAKVETCFSDRLPANYDAGIAVDASTARWVLGAAPQPGPMHLRTGDLQLLDRFITRYLARLNMVAIRAGRRS